LPSQSEHAIFGCAWQTRLWLHNQYSVFVTPQPAQVAGWLPAPCIAHACCLRAFALVACAWHTAHSNIVITFNFDFDSPLSICFSDSDIEIERNFEVVFVFLRFCAEHARRATVRFSLHNTPLFSLRGHGQPRRPTLTSAFYAMPSGARAAHVPTVVCLRASDAWLQLGATTLIALFVEPLALNSYG